MTFESDDLEGIIPVTGGARKIIQGQPGGGLPDPPWLNLSNRFDEKPRHV